NRCSGKPAGKASELPAAPRRSNRWHTTHSCTGVVHVPQFAEKLAAERPEEIALRDEQKALTWAEVNELLNRVANGLLAMDLGTDRRIAVFAENAAETALANLGGLIAGASVVPVNFHLTADEVAYILEDSGARVLFVGPETAERGVQAAAQSRVHTVIGWTDTE